MSHPQQLARENASTRDRMLGFYWKVRPLLAPGLVFSQQIYENILAENVESDFAWLDLGCGHRLLPEWRGDEEKALVARARFLVGLDYDMPSLEKHRSITKTIQGDITNLPLRDESFDLITANMVFEHLDDPAVQLTELRRVLKPGGRLIFHTPNVYGYSTVMARLIPETVKDKLVYMLQKRRGEDLFRTYYRINSEARIRDLAGKTGFHVPKVRMVVTDAEFIAVPPLAVLELLWIRLLMTSPMRRSRTSIIAFLEKPKGA